MFESETNRVNPLRNPSYPQRVHIREKAQWLEVLRTWENRLETARNERATKSSPEADELLIQMAGARDQISDAAARMPMECGELYEEDKHRLERAVAAFERMAKRWEGLR